MSNHNSLPDSPLSNGPDKGNDRPGVNLKFNQDDLWNRESKRIEQQDEQVPGELSSFPVSVFPSTIQEIIYATNECLNFPADFIGTSILFATSLAIGNTYKVEVRKGWRESPVLFFANVGRPGTIKTHPLCFALQPILDIQEGNYSSYLIKKKEYDRTSKLSPDERKEQGIEDPVRPYLEKYILTDFTPEALIDVHKYNKRGIGVYADELASWFKNFNRYHKGSEGETWLSIWSGKQLSIDRKGSDPLLITLPYIPVGGNIQTSILYELAKDSRGQNGFIDRILFGFPQGLKKPYWNEKQIEGSIIESWAKILNKILSVPLRVNEHLNPDPEIISFTPEAYIALAQWQKENANLCNAQEDEKLAGIFSKFEIHAVRLALILEFLSWATNKADQSIQHVGIDAVKGALSLVDYFRATAVTVHNIISSNNPLDRLPEDKRQFYNALPEAFTTAEGLTVAESLHIPSDTYHKWLKVFTGTLLKKVKKGNYEKMV